MPTSLEHEERSDASEVLLGAVDAVLAAQGDLSQYLARELQQPEVAHVQEHRAAEEDGEVSAYLGRELVHKALVL